MADITIKRGDRLPIVEATLTGADGEPIDLTASTVRFLMRKDGAIDLRVSAAATIVDAAEGTVKYEWAAGDTIVAGDFLAEFEVTFADGKKQTFPATEYLEVTIISDLDP